MEYEPDIPPTPAPPDWSDLLPRVQAGEAEAARAVVTALHDQVRKIVLSHLPRRDEPEDLMQETFLRVFARLDQYRGSVPFPHWVARIALHVCLDRLRRQRVRPEWRWADLSAAQQRCVESVAAQEEEATAPPECARELLEKLLAGLSPREQMVIRWLELEEKSISDVCALTGWNSGLVRILAFRARRKLRALYLKLEKTKP